MTDTAAPALTDTRYASRKFILAALAFLAACIGRAAGLLTPELAVDLVKCTLGLYFTGNVAATVAASIANALTPKQ